MPATAKDKSSKRASGGRAEGKAAAKARQKNNKAVDDYFDMMERVSDTEDLDIAVARTGLRLGLVTKMLGCGHLDIQLQDGTGVRLPIAKSIAFNGRAASKTDRANCILTGDLVVLRDAMVAGKVPLALVEDIEAHCERLGLESPVGFFTRGIVDEAELPTWEFDRSDERERLRAAAAAADDDGSDVDIDAI
jgi:hypothetical protein